MDIKGVVHCLFEQSGTFKREFGKLGFKAYDYDIENEFGQTDFVVDLFSEIERGWNGGESVFDGFRKEDLLMAFFPCIHFCQTSRVMMSWTCSINKQSEERNGFHAMHDNIIRLSEERERFYVLLLKLFGICRERGLRLIFENPIDHSYLLDNFLKRPSVVDMNRMTRGDEFVKPTGYWFVNCEPEHGETFQFDKSRKLVFKMRGSRERGKCSKERSMIHPDYARNFICDFIIGGCNSVPQQLPLCDEWMNIP